MENLNIIFKASDNIKVARKNGKVYLCIEVNECNTFKSEKGNEFVTLTAIESTNSQYGDTHFVKVQGNYNKETKVTTGLDYICGNIKPMKKKEQQQQVPPLEQPKEGEEDGELPF